MSELRHALKEWAALCRALAEGRQALVLRKGGIAESTGEFQVEQPRFWLYPTFVHQQAAGILPEAASLLPQAEHDRPPAGKVRLSHWAEVAGIYQVHDLATALKLGGLHLWTPEVVTQRFTYRVPGLYVLPLRVYRSPAAVEIAETADYAGCRSWVALEQALPTAGSTPVLDDASFDALVRELERRLDPVATV